MSLYNTYVTTAKCTKRARRERERGTGAGGGEGPGHVLWGARGAQGAKGGQVIPTHHTAFHAA